MTQLYIIRHGAYEHAEEAPHDGGLSPEGISQAQKLKDRLADEQPGIDVLVSSSLSRAIQTAEIIAPVLKLPVEIEADLDEWRNQGEGALSQNELISQYLALPADQRAFINPGSGLETWAAFGFRAVNALNRIAQKYAKQRLAIVAHGGIVEASFAYCFGVSPFAATPFMMMLDPGYTSITEWRYLHQVNIWRLERYNDLYHLLK